MDMDMDIHEEYQILHFHDFVQKNFQDSVDKNFHHLIFKYHIILNIIYLN